MAVKTANVSVRVEPSIKEEAENVLDRLGISSSTVINMLYRQIIMLQGIPFQATIPAPLTREEMDDATFNAIMQRGLDEAKSGKGRPASEVIANLRKGI
mgnify:FL=1